jgi:hypothetical protein
MAIPMKTLVVATLLCAVAVVAPSAYTTKYRVTVTADKQVNFSKLKTYSWLESHFVANAQIEGQIVSAINRELRDLGLTNAESGQADVIVTYAAYSRTDVQYKAKAVSKDVYPAYPVGILVVSLLEPTQFRRVLELRATTPLTRPELGAEIDNTVQAMFKRYPVRPRS